MRRKLTITTALKECIRIWTALAESGSRQKGSVAGAVKYAHRCPCCEYNEQNDHQYCEDNCIIKWPTPHCEDRDSPYWGWLDAWDATERKRYAREIIKLAKKALKKGDAK